MFAYEYHYPLGTCDLNRGDCDTMSNVAHDWVEDARKQGYRTSGSDIELPEPRILVGEGFLPPLGRDANDLWITLSGDAAFKQGEKPLYHVVLQMGRWVVDLTGAQFGQRYRYPFYTVATFKKRWKRTKYVRSADRQTNQIRRMLIKQNPFAMFSGSTMTMPSAIRVASRYREAFDKFALRQKALAKMLSVGGTFGVISAYSTRSKKQNKERHGDLIADLQRLGYRKVTPLKGSWEGVTEKSVLVQRIRPEDLFALGRKYTQDAVIYKSKDGVIGMYYTKGKPRAEVAVDPKGDASWEIATDPSLYSKARGISFEFGFLWGQEVPWDGRNPISRKQLRALVQHELQF